MVVQLVIAFILVSLLNIKKLRMRKLYKTIISVPAAMSMQPMSDFAV